MVRPGLGRFIAEMKMSKHYRLIGLIVISLGLMISPAGLIAQVRFMPALGDAPLSNQFRVKINGHETSVEKMWNLDVPIHYAQLVYDRSTPLMVEITVDNPIKGYAISPRRKKIKGEINGKKLSFAVNDAGYLLVKIDNMEDLFLLINPAVDYKKQLGNKPIIDITKYGVNNTGKVIETEKIQQAIDDAAKNHAVLYFPDGIYRSGELNIKSSMTVYLSDGALICGSHDPKDYPDNSLIRLRDASDVELLGNGTIDGAGWSGLRGNGAQGIYLVYASGCNSILVDGPVLRDPVFWNTRIYRSKNVQLRNIKILNNRPYKNWTNTDGVDFDSSVDCSLRNAVIHSGDDNIVVKGLERDGLFPAENIVVDNVLTLSNSAATKIGTETGAKYFKNISFSNIDVVKCKRAMVIEALDSTKIEHVRFENITIENFDYNGTEAPHLIDFSITDKSWRPAMGNCTVKGVNISNINTLCSFNGVQSQIVGKNDTYSIDDVVLQSIRLEGKEIQSFRDIRLITNQFAKSLKLVRD
jgi:polygalacturonase